MRKKVVFIVLILIILTGVFATPALLRTIPPRYAARYLPVPLQAIAAPRTESPILPTAASSANMDALLTTDGVSEIGSALDDESPPPTLTAVPPVESVVTEDVSTETTAMEPTSEPTATATSSPTATPTETAVPIPVSARLENFQHQFQDWNNCGPATMAMTMSYFGLALTQYDTAFYLKPNPEDRNVSPYEMVDFVNEQTAFKAIERANGTADTIKRLVAEGVPVILEIGIEPPGEYRWMGWYGHYLLVVAYDDTAEQLWVYDSWLGTSLVPGENADSNGRALSYEELETYWPQFNRNYIAVFAPEKETAVHAIIGQDLDDTKMWQRNLATAQSDAISEPGNAFYWFNLGTVYNALERYEEAAAAFDQARAIGLPWRMLWYQFGPYEAYYQVGRYEDVILLADVTLKDRPYFEESFYYRGLAHQALGNRIEAVKDFSAATKFNPYYEPAAQALADS